MDEKREASETAACAWELQVGDVVLSLCGRDQNRCFFVIGREKPYVFLADGRLRRLEKPKTKKAKHVKFVARPAALALRGGELSAVEAFREGGRMTNAEAWRALRQFNGMEEDDHGQRRCH